MEKFKKYFSDTSKLCEEFGKTSKGITFDEEKQAIELYALTSIGMCSQHTLSISLLLRNNIMTDCFILSRNLMEIFFNLNWASKGHTREEMNDRVFQLEANPFYCFEKEIVLMEENLKLPNSILDKSFVHEHRDAIDKEKENFPFLLENRNDPLSKFKKLSQTSFADRVGDLRLKYYHLYRFSSWFVHPTPKLKEFFMQRIVMKDCPENVITKPLKITLSYSLLFIELCFALAKYFLFNFNPELNPQRQELYNQLSKIVDDSNEGYFGIPAKNYYAS